MAMNERIKDVLTCPICYELFTKPVLVLPCQHSLCKLCIVKLIKSNLEQRCPTCRQRFSLQSGRVNELPRNILVEQMIDELNETNSAASTFTEENNAIDIDSQLSLVEKFLKGMDYGKARLILLNLEAKLENLNLLKVKINLIRCFIQSRESPAAIEQQVLLLSSTLASIDLQPGELENASVLIREFSKELLFENLHMEAIQILEQNSNMCCKVLDPSKQLDEHMSCLEQLQKISRCVVRCRKVNEFKKHGYDAITQIYRNATRPQMSDKKLQCIKITWSLKYVGTCYNEIGDYDRAVEYNERAVRHLKTNFGEDASKQRVLGIVYHNLGAAKKNLKAFSDAEKAYLQAIEIYHSAKDWPSVERRNKSVILSAIGLSEVHDK